MDLTMIETLFTAGDMWECFKAGMKHAKDTSNPSAHDYILPIYEKLKSGQVEYIMCKNQFIVDENENSPIGLAECPNCGDTVVWNDGCVNCCANFIFEDKAVASKEDQRPKESRKLAMSIIKKPKKKGYKKFIVGTDGFKTKVSKISGFMSKKQFEWLSNISTDDELYSKNNSDFYTYTGMNGIVLYIDRAFRHNQARPWFYLKTFGRFPVKK